MSSCLSGGGLNLDLIKPPPSFSTSISSSPSTLTESTNSPISIFTRKARTPRKRPNQTYNEAAAILSTARPKIFPTTQPFKFTKSQTLFPPEPSELLYYPPRRSTFSSNPSEKPCRSPGEVSSQGNWNCTEIFFQNQENFDAESMLDEEIGEGIDSIMGYPAPEIESIECSNSIQSNNESIDCSSSIRLSNCCYGYPVGLGFDFGFGMRRELRAIRNVDEDWWRFPSVINVADITQKIAKIPVEKKKKKKNSDDFGPSEEPVTPPSGGLLLNLNYDGVLSAWSDMGSPFAGDASDGNDVQARLAQIDLFPEEGSAETERGTIMLRYKDKRRARLFSKKIRNVSSDPRPRMKEKNVRTENSGDDD